MTARVLVLTKTLARGGTERLVLDTLRHRDAERFEYEVAFVDGGGPNGLVDDLRATEVPVRRLGRRALARREIRDLVEGAVYDIVHVHSPHLAVYARLAARGRKRPRVVYTEHAGWDTHRFPPVMWANAWTFERNDYVFAVSDRVRTSIRYPAPLRTRGMPPIETLIHGIDRPDVGSWMRAGAREEFGIEPGAPVVGCVANFTRQKAHEDLLAAFGIVRRRVPAARLVLVGGGPLEERTRAIVRSSGLEDAIVFAGVRADVPRLLAMFDVFVLSSEHEGLPVALLEAMACACPPVATAVGGVPEVIREGEGVLTPSRDPDRLADAVVDLLDDDDRRHAIGAAARRRSASFDVRNATRRIETVYSELLHA